MREKDNSSQFVVATPTRSVCDNNARVLEEAGLLRFIALGTRHGTYGVPSERTRLNPWIGLSAYLGAKILPPFRAESFRFGLLPWFDRWVLKQLRRGDHMISSYGYTNSCFKSVRARGGKTFLDAGNSHPESFWQIVSEEHARWKCPYPPVSRQWHDRSVSMLEDTDYILSPSSYVTRSFLDRGFDSSRILENVYPIDLEYFRPSSVPRPKNRPFTVISTSSLSLRKGTPYLLEAFRTVQKAIPDARLLLSRIVEDSVKDIISRYSDLNIEWSRGLPHSELAERLRSADIFVLPSLEEGLARTAIEAMACGLPVVVTPNTGANDWVSPGKNGEVVPIRDSKAIADALLEWSDRIRSAETPGSLVLESEKFSFGHFKDNFLGQLRQKRIIK